MHTATLVTTVACPGCLATQEVACLEPGCVPTVTACQQCQANLVLVPPLTHEQRQAPATANPPASSPIPSAPACPPRSAIVAISMLTVLGYLCVAALLYSASYGVKQLPPYRPAEQFVAHHPVLTQALGEPLTFGRFPTAQMRRDGRKLGGYVELTVSGPRGSGEVAMSLVHEQRTWRIVEAEYQLGDGDTQPLWVQFPGDYELHARVDELLNELDEAINARDVDAILEHVAPEATIRLILETPPPRQVRTYRTREEYRGDLLAEMLMVKHLAWTREETDIRLSPDGQTATGAFQGLHERVIQGKPATVRVDTTFTCAFRGGQPVFTIIDSVQQTAERSR